MTTLKSKRVETINNLLAKAESSQFPAEAKAFSSKAQTLMSQWAIDDAVLRTGRETDELEVGISEIPIEYNSYYGGRRDLLNAIGRHNNCRILGSAIQHASQKPTHRTIYVVGTQSDRDWVQTLYLSLLTQSTTEQAMAWMLSDFDAHKNTWQITFMNGYVESIREQFREAQALAEMDARKQYGDQTVALVLQTTKDVVDEKFREMFPDVQSERRGRRRGQFSGNAWDAGRAAGSKSSTRRSSRIGSGAGMLGA